MKYLTIHPEVSSNYLSPVLLILRKEDSEEAHKSAGTHCSRYMHLRDVIMSFFPLGEVDDDVILIVAEALHAGRC
jgi:hypothetical protein